MEREKDEEFHRRRIIFLLKNGIETRFFLLFQLITFNSTLLNIQPGVNPYHGGGQRFKGTVSLFLTRAPMISLTILMNEFLVRLQDSFVERRNREERDVFRLLLLCPGYFLLFSGYFFIVFRLLLIVTSGFFLHRKK